MSKKKQNKKKIEQKRWQKYFIAILGIVLVVFMLSVVVYCLEMIKEDRLQYSKVEIRKNQY